MKLCLLPLMVLTLTAQDLELKNVHINMPNTPDLLPEEANDNKVPPLDLRHMEDYEHIVTTYFTRTVSKRVAHHLKQKLQRASNSPHHHERAAADLVCRSLTRNETTQTSRDLPMDQPQESTNRDIKSFLLSAANAALSELQTKADTVQEESDSKVTKKKAVVCAGLATVIAALGGVASTLLVKYLDHTC